jgi:ribonuclease HII
LMIKGDTRIRCIAAASILAKVTRDRLMVRQVDLEENMHKHIVGDRRLYTSRALNSLSQTLLISRDRSNIR